MAGKLNDGVAAQPAPDEVELEERKGMAMDSVPEPYLDAWTRLQCQKLGEVSDSEWRLAIDDAGRFFYQWGSLAVEFQWPAGELFDVPRDNGTCGLVWFLKGERVRALGPEHAALGDGTRVFDRVTASRVGELLHWKGQMQKPLYSEDGWRCCVIMNFIMIRCVMYELCFMISGGVILYFFSMGVDYNRMAGPAVVCASALLGYLRENKRHSALQELYEKLED